MDFLGIIVVSTIFIIFLVAFIISFKDGDIKTLKYVTLLKNETKVLFPIAIFLLGYQIIKTGSWDLSPKTYNYILVFLNMVNFFMIIIYNFLRESNSRFAFGIWLGILFTPFMTLAFLIMTFCTI